MPRLNRTLVDSLAPPISGERVVLDSEVPGFGVRVMPSGLRSYFVRYRVGGGRKARTQRATIGRHPQMTPERARQAARDVLAKARIGNDPVEDKNRRNASSLLSTAVHEWLDGPGLRTRRGRVKSAASYACDRARMINHVIPLLGAVRLCDLGRRHVETLRDAVAEGRTGSGRQRTRPRGIRHVKGGEAVASRTVAGLSTFLGWAVEVGMIERNVALGVHKPVDRQCERFLDEAEIAALWSSFDEWDARRPRAVAILRLLLLTGCRFNEIASLKWAEADLAFSMLRLPRTKTGSRTIFLSAAAVELLRRLPREVGSEWVFPATRGSGSYKGVRKVWPAILRAARLEGVRIHDLRHTFASTAVGRGVSLEVLSKLLGHREIRTTARYAHLADAAVRQATETVSEVVQGSA